MIQKLCSVYILKGDASQEKMRCARECSMRDRRYAGKGSVVRVEREHFRATLLLHLGNV